ncbi:hypothetical protein [Glutamicibacter sp. NPDC087344]|uniref:hypothetical protein n=1 Tax=Glutamicibacter sp. NPDC087344 TaxID=3363994 RepID=UPI0037F62E5F
MKKPHVASMSFLAISMFCLAGATGCVSEDPQAASSETSATVASQSPAASSTEPETKATKTKDSPTEDDTQEPTAKSESSAKQSESTPNKTSKASAEDIKTPKTWPKDSREGDEQEASVTEGFIAETEGLTSPNFDKNVLSPETTLPEPPDYSEFATGAALGELEAQFTEYANNNWKQSGKVVVIGESKVEDLVIDDVPTHRVYLCLDSSDLQVSEPDGFVVTARVEPGTRTALNIYDLQEREGQLFVVDHIFPENPDC